MAVCPVCRLVPDGARRLTCRPPPTTPGKTLFQSCLSKISCQPKRRRAWRHAPPSNPAAPRVDLRVVIRSGSRFTSCLSAVPAFRQDRVDQRSGAPSINDGYPPPSNQSPVEAYDGIVAVMEKSTDAKRDPNVVPRNNQTAELRPSGSRSTARRRASCAKAECEVRITAGLTLCSGTWAGHTCRGGGICHDG